MALLSAFTVNSGCSCGNSGRRDSLGMISGMAPAVDISSSAALASRDQATPAIVSRENIFTASRTSWWSSMVNSQPEVNRSISSWMVAKRASSAVSNASKAWGLPCSVAVSTSSLASRYCSVRMLKCCTRTTGSSVEGSRAAGSTLTTADSSSMAWDWMVITGVSGYSHLERNELGGIVARWFLLLRRRRPWSRWFRPRLGSRKRARATAGKRRAMSRTGTHSCS
mmetsp:Transcript_11043/g.19762  ORF Transcript_11043/g.19762 Transcript_11043/m.19762 type:complete len:225 (+) Transcript_11043:954-1628(+)